ncbi:MAG: FAD-binding domain [Vicinamibacterales bacterium]
MRVAINGAGVAGPALAFWLSRQGHEVLLVEQAPSPRRGGYVIDFWGLGYDLAERMGVLPRILDLGYQVAEVRFVDAHGRPQGGFGTAVFAKVTGGRFTSVRRSDLALTIADALDGRVERLFGDSIAAIDDSGPRVRVSFEHAPSRDVDLVVGADGLHSRVRDLVFGPVAEVSLGYHVAAFEVSGYDRRDDLVYMTHGVPGRQVSRFSMRDDRTLFLFVVRDEYLPRGPIAASARKAAVRRAFDGVGWECPRILELMDGVDDLYFDRVSQIRMDTWSRGRTVLIGDAAACVSLMAGEGTGLALMEAYVLAGELQASGGMVGPAFSRYEERLQGFLRRKQTMAARFASSFAPATAAGVWMRNLVTRLFRVPLVATLLVGRQLRDDIVLPDYGG